MNAAAPGTVSGLPIVEAQDLAQTYRIRRGFFKQPALLHAVRGVSFSLHAGRTLAVVGESGCGKSTLARMLALAERPASGTLHVDGQALADARDDAVQAMRRKVQMVFQNPYGSLNPRQRIDQILEGPLEINTTLNAAERRSAAQAMLEQVGLRPEHGARYPHMFSGGQRQRIAIARALMLKPALLVADEPVSALDVSIQAQILNLLADLQAEFGLAYLFISHDLEVVRFLAHDVLVMYLGQVMEYGDKTTVYQRPMHPYTRALMAASPGSGAAGRAKQQSLLQGELPSPLNPPSGCVFSTRCPHAVGRCHQERPALEMVHGRQVACHEARKLDTDS